MLPGIVGADDKDVQPLKHSPKSSVWSSTFSLLDGMDGGLTSDVQFMNALVKSMTELGIAGTDVREVHPLKQFCISCTPDGIVGAVTKLMQFA